MGINGNIGKFLIRCADIMKDVIVTSVLYGCTNRTSPACLEAKWGSCMGRGRNNLPGIFCVYSKHISSNYGFVIVGNLKESKCTFDLGFGKHQTGFIF